MTYTIWIDLGNGLWDYESANSLVEAIAIGDATNAADIIYGDQVYRRVGDAWSSYTMVTIDVT
jgi:hypothetical protein